MNKQSFLFVCSALLVWGGFAACSAGDAAKGGRADPNNPTRPRAGGSTGLNLGGAANATGGTASVPEDPVYSCTQNEDCCPQDANCASAEEYVCTIEGKCGKVTGTCGSGEDCQNDTYCCDASCQKNSAAAPVCIPNSIPPGIACRGGSSAPGAFSPALQCEWKVPATDTNGGFILASPLVADLPNDAGASAEILAVTYNAADGDGDANLPGTLRILSGQDCALLETIEASVKKVRAASAPAIADLDGDGVLEIVARRNNNGLIAFAWDGSRYALKWEAEGPDLSSVKRQTWDGPSIHDIDDDGSPEIILWDAVYSADGVRRYAGNLHAYLGYNGYIPVLGDLDADGKVEIVLPYGLNGINYSEWTGSEFKGEGKSNNGPWFGPQSVQYTHFAIADFGTPGATFTPGVRDGKAEIVAVASECERATCGGGRVSVFTLDGSEVLSVTTLVDPLAPTPPPIGNESGGPPTIGNLDSDPTPEFAVAGATRLRVFDFECQAKGPGCEDRFIKWSRASQDASSRQTGASIFDFEGDGKAEVVYGDECFVRVYAGDTGEVLFSSYRSSATWFEGPIIADVDKDQNTEIVVGSAYAVDCPASASPGSTRNKPYVDPLHPGVRCDSDDACLPGSACEAGFCRCQSESECCKPGQSLEECGLSCAPPLSGGGKNVCRAMHPNSAAAEGGVRVLRDRLDRWASSRALWNQHAYSITNIEDTGSIPKTSAWRQNFSVAEPGYNSYRQNVQGSASAEDLPDITGRLTDSETCVLGDTSGDVFLQATVCNRGRRAVGAALPATFFLGDPNSGKPLCTSYTDGPVPTGGCKLVYCTVPSDVVPTLIEQEVTLVVNRDASGARATVECRPDNNLSSIRVRKCDVQVPR